MTSSPLPPLDLGSSAGMSGGLAGAGPTLITPVEGSASFATLLAGADPVPVATAPSTAPVPTAKEPLAPDCSVPAFLGSDLNTESDVTVEVEEPAEGPLTHQALPSATPAAPAPMTFGLAPVATIMADKAVAGSTAVLSETPPGQAGTIARRGDRAAVQAECEPEEDRPAEVPDQPSNPASAPSAIPTSQPYGLVESPKLLLATGLKRGVASTTGSEGDVAYSPGRTTLTMMTGSQTHTGIPATNEPDTRLPATREQSRETLGLTSAAPPVAGQIALAPSRPPPTDIAPVRSDEHRLALGRDFADQLGLAIARHAKAGGEELTVRMQPAELGRLDIRLAFDDAGGLRAVVSGDNAQVLDQIRRDLPDLTRALGDAGVRTDEGSFRFERGSDQAPSSGSGSQQQARGGDGGAGRHGQPRQSPTSWQRPLRRSGRLDLMA